MNVVEREIVDDVEERDECWSVYERAFAPLRSQAVQRHVMHRAEFDEVLLDKRVLKYLVVDDDQSAGAGARRLAALTTLTNDLEAVPLVSPEYFAARWPKEYADGRIWYVGFLGIDPDYRRTSASTLLVSAVCARPAGAGGVVGVDICDHNETTMRMSHALKRLGRAVSSETALHRLDAQTYWAYEFPAPDADAHASPGYGRVVRQPSGSAVVAATVMTLPEESVHLDSKSDALTAAPHSQP